MADIDHRKNVETASGLLNCITDKEVRDLVLLLIALDNLNVSANLEGYDSVNNICTLRDCLNNKFRESKMHLTDRHIVKTIRNIIYNSDDNCSIVVIKTEILYFYNLISKTNLDQYQKLLLLEFLSNIKDASSVEAIENRIDILDKRLASVKEQVDIAVRCLFNSKTPEVTRISRPKNEEEDAEAKSVRTILWNNSKK